MRQTSDGRFLLYPGFTSNISVNIDGNIYEVYGSYPDGGTELTVSQALSTNGNTARGKKRGVTSTPLT
jgi:hypothetical protein